MARIKIKVKRPTLRKNREGWGTQTPKTQIPRSRTLSFRLLTFNSRLLTLYSQLSMFWETAVAWATTQSDDFNRADASPISNSGSNTYNTTDYYQPHNLVTNAVEGSAGGRRRAPPGCAHGRPLPPRAMQPECTLPCHRSLDLLPPFLSVSFRVIRG